MNKIIALLNPASGSMDFDAARATLERYSQQTGSQLEICRTEPNGSLADVAAAAVANGCSRIIAAGGDGTIAEVATGLVNCQCELAILPCGTANLLAKALEIPLELEAAAELAVTGTQCRDIDAMQVEGEILLVHISVGSYSYISDTTTPQAKQRFGRLAYLYSTLREILRSRRWRFEIRVDDKTYSHRSAFVLVTNVNAIGPADWRWNEDTRLDDGEIEVCVVDADDVLAYFRYLVHVLRGQPTDFEGLTRYHARELVEIKTRSRVPVSGDGEVIGHSSVKIGLLPGALRVVSPQTD